MTFRRIAVLTTALLAFSAAAPAHQDAGKAVASLHWSAVPMHLPTSNSTVAPPAHSIGIQGADAQTFEKYTNADTDPALEAVVANPHSGELVFIEYDDAGYVTVDDWKSIDAAKMLKNISDNTEAHNAELKSQGIPALHVIGWLQKPAYDSATKTVRWAISARREDEKVPLVNAISLILGRHGYEKLTWVGLQSQYRLHGGLLDRVVAGDHFNPGARYQDFISGDKLAGYGIAALVGTAAGATIAKTVGFGGLLLLIKKLWVLIVAGIVGAFRWLRAKVQRTPTSPEGNS